MAVSHEVKSDRFDLNGHIGGIVSMERNEDVFVGRIELRLDPSGRFRIPPEWFDKVGRGKYVYAMADPKERCLRLVPASNMEARLAKMRERAIIDPAMNRALQVIGENSEQVEVDNEGCICISEKLLAFAGITRQLVMVGGEWYAQLWSPEELGRKEAK